jgi:hypothetical protein
MKKAVLFAGFLLPILQRNFVRVYKRPATKPELTGSPDVIRLQVWSRVF